MASAGDTLRPSLLPKSRSRILPSPSDPQLNPVSKHEGPTGKLRKLGSFTNSITSPIGNAIRSISRSARLPSNGPTSSSNIISNNASGNKVTGRSKQSSIPKAAFEPCSSSPMRLAPSAHAQKVLQTPVHKVLPRSSTISHLPLPSRPTSSLPGQELSTSSRSGSARLGSGLRLESPLRTILTRPNPNARKILANSGSKLPVSTAEDVHRGTGSALRDPSLPTLAKAAASPSASGRSGVMRSRTEPNMLLPLMRAPGAFLESNKENMSKFEIRSGERTADPSVLNDEALNEKRLTITSLDQEDPRDNPNFSHYSLTAEVNVAGYAFNARKMTPSVAYATANAGSSGDTKRQTELEKLQHQVISKAPRTCDSKDAGLITPRRSSGRPIAEYKLMQPIQPESPFPSATQGEQLSPSKFSTPKRSPRPLILFPTTQSHGNKPSPLRHSVESDLMSEVKSTCSSPRSLRTPRADHSASLLQRQVASYMPSNYWAGRFSSLHGRMRNETLVANRQNLLNIEGFGNTGKEGSSNSAQRHLKHPRMKQDVAISTEETLAIRIFESLEKMCISKESLRSLRQFEGLYANRHGMTTLRNRSRFDDIKVQGSLPVKLAGKTSLSPPLTNEENAYPAFSRKRLGFMDKLMQSSAKARERRSFIKLEGDGNGSEGGLDRNEYFL